MGLGIFLLIFTASLFGTPSFGMLPSGPFPDIIGHSIRLSVRPTSVVTLYREFKLDDQGRATQPFLIPSKAVLYLHSESFYSAGLITSVLSMGIKKKSMGYFCRRQRMPLHIHH